MQIPYANQINAPTPLQPSPGLVRTNISPQDMGTGVVATAGAQLAAGVANDAFNIEAKQAAEAKRRDEELAQSQALAAKVKFEDSTDSTLTDIQTAVKSGQLKREDAPAKYQELTKKARDDAMGGVPADMQPHTAVLLDATAMRGARVVDKITETARTDEIKTNLGTIADSMAKQATMPGADVAKINEEYAAQAMVLGKSAGIPDAVLTKHIQDFKDSTNYGAFKTRFIDTGENIQSLKAFAKDVRGTDLIDQDKKLSLLSATESKIATLENRNAIHAEAAMRKATATYTALTGFMDSGRMPTAEYSAQTLAALKGTPFEASARAMIQQAPESVGFSSAPIQAQQQALQMQLAEMNKNGSTPAAEKAYQKRDTMFKATLEDIKKDPLNAALERNVIRDISPLNLADLSTLPQQLAARQEVTGRVSAWAGKTVSPFTQAEADQISLTVGKLPPEQKASVLRAMSSAVPAPQMMVLSKQIGEKDQQLGIATVLSTRDTTIGRNVGELYLKGKQAITEGRAKIDPAKETGIKAQIYDGLQGVYASPDATTAAADATMAVYAQLKAEGRDSVKQALDLVTGGVKEHNGGKIAKPYGWTDDRFTHWLETVTPDKLGADHFTVNGHEASAQTLTETLPGARLLPYGESKYLIQAGNDVVRLPGGLPYVLQVK